MKKRTKIILGIIIGVLVFYSAFMTLGVYFVTQEYNDLNAKYKEELGANLAVKKKEVDETNKKLDESIKLMKLEVFARLIDENAVINISSDESAIIRFNMGKKTTKEMVEKLQEYIALVPDAITEAELKTCILCITDSNGDVKFGYTIHPDKTSTTFLSDK